MLTKRCRKNQHHPHRALSLR